MKPAAKPIFGSIPTSLKASVGVKGVLQQSQVVLFLKLNYISINNKSKPFYRRCVQAQ
jgi:hypothetical protein